LIFIEHDQTFVESVATEILDLTHYSLSIKWEYLTIKLFWLPQWLSTCSS
jgi:ATPase subunit of ABC transporter with duplicated ATPase domains